MSELISEQRFSCFSGGSQTYIEDCQVCCQPMGVVVDVGADGEQSVRVERAS
jgi:hypothetical protein